MLSLKKEQKHLHIILEQKVMYFNKKTKKFYNLRNIIQDKRKELV